MTLRKFHFIGLPAIFSTVFLLSGCPSPPDYTYWKRSGTNKEGVIAAMKACGEPETGSLNDLPLNAQVLQYQCMQHLGFKRKDGLVVCEVVKDVPACAEEKQGHPLSISQLETLPFVGDEAFFPINPDSGRNEAMQITWRKAGASQHFREQITNNQQALPVMYDCGYPRPLGSNLSVATIGRSSEVQRCMIDHGFEPKNKDMLVCRQYPQVTGCADHEKKNG